MNNIEINIYSKSGTLPEYKTEYSSGVDLCSMNDVTLEPGTVSIINTGIFVSIPKGYEGQIRPRSGFSTKNKVIIPNSPGTIDADYRGEVKVALLNLNDIPILISKNDRIAQLIFAPIAMAKFNKIENENMLDSTERGSGGFGSTGS